MKELKIFLHRNRAGDVVRALKDAGFRNISVVDVKGMLEAIADHEREYSIDLGDAMITEVKIEVVCEAVRVDEAVALVRRHGRTGRPEAGWIYVIDIRASHAIETGAP